MQIHQIKCFVAAARNGSITKAAKQMYITQSAMSQAVSQLEKELGVKLFETSGRGVVLSSIGKKILLNAQMIIDECNLIKHECELQQSGKMTVTYIAPALPTQSTAMVREFYEKYHTIGVVRQPLIDGHAEIIINQTLNENFTEKRVRLLTEEIGLIVPKDHMFYGCRGMELGKLAPYPVLSLNRASGAGMREVEDYFCGLAGFTPARDREAFTLEELIEMTVSGAGIVFFPFKLWGIETIEPERIIRLTNPRCYRHIYAEQCLNPESNEQAVQTFFEFIIQYFRNY
jgi:DNA-binding transcriptional LysR family regulator